MDGRTGTPPPSPHIWLRKLLVVLRSLRSERAVSEPSTVLDLTVDPARILRLGSLGPDDLAAVGVPVDR